MAGWRLMRPVLLATVCLAALCAVVAVSLFRQQTTTAHDFRENTASRRAVVELEECLNDLLALEHTHSEAVEPLHERVRIHIVTVVELADEPEAQKLAKHLAREIDLYLAQWRVMPAQGSPGHKLAVQKAAHDLETRVLRSCTELRLHIGRRLEETAHQHERVLNALGWGMAGIAGLGGIAGLVLGFGVARFLSRSIRRLQIQIRDAAGKLGPAIPEIVLVEQAEFSGLHREIDELTARIETVVSELQQREREVLRAEQLAAVGQLAAGIGHEIRNPLTSIKLLVQSAIADPVEAALSSEDLRMIEEDIRRVEQSLRTFLDFARPALAERRQVDLLEVLIAVQGLIRGRAEKQRVTVQVEAPPGSYVLQADPGQLRQVFVNLALNALDAMPTGGALVIRVRSQRDRLEVEIADTGPGISPGILPRLFTPFVSSKDTGLGLGLVISRRIVEDHGGAIDAGNRLTGGASFFVRIPTGEQ